MLLWCFQVNAQYLLNFQQNQIIMTYNEHKTETLLLKERFILINQCVESKFIRLRGNSLYVHMTLCKIHNFAMFPNHIAQKITQWILQLTQKLILLRFRYLNQVLTQTVVTLPVRLRSQIDLSGVSPFIMECMQLK